MKINEVLMTDQEQIIEKIKKECSEILNIYNSTKDVLYRGDKTHSEDYFYDYPRSNRPPVNSDPTPIKFIDQTLNFLGFKALRSNSIYTISSFRHAKKFRGGGEIYVIFPTNGFNYTWCTNIPDICVSNFEMSKLLSIPALVPPNYDYSDLYSHELTANDMLAIQKEFNFKNNDIKTAIKREHEVWFNSKYYAVACFTEYLERHPILNQLLSF